jgi:hypothetical protein
MKYRPHTWIDLETNETTYGIQANTGYAQWKHVSKGNKPLFFKTKDEAKQWIKENRS